MGHHTPLLDPSANWKSFKRGTVKRGCCLHVLVERYKNGKSQFEYATPARAAHRIKGFGQVHENRKQRTGLLNVLLFSWSCLSENTCIPLH